MEVYSSAERMARPEGVPVDHGDEVTTGRHRDAGADLTTLFAANAREPRVGQRRRSGSSAAVAAATAGRPVSTPRRREHRQVGGTAVVHAGGGTGRPGGAGRSGPIFGVVRRVVLIG